MSDKTGQTWPTCCVCKKPVAKVTKWEDKATNQTCWLFECHGARDEVRVDNTRWAVDSAALPGRTLRRGVAQFLAPFGAPSWTLPAPAREAP